MDEDNEIKTMWHLGYQAGGNLCWWTAKVRKVEDVNDCGTIRPMYEVVERSEWFGGAGNKYFDDSTDCSLDRNTILKSWMKQRAIDINYNLDQLEGAYKLMKALKNPDAIKVITK